MYMFLRVRRLITTGRRHQSKDGDVKASRRETQVQSDSALEWRRQRRDERGATTKVIKGMIEERGEAWTDGRAGGRRKEEGGRPPNF